MTQLILHRDEAGESKRFAFVTYAEKESATACLEKLEGLEVAGKALAVSLCQVQVGFDKILSPLGNASILFLILLVLSCVSCSGW